MKKLLYSLLAMMIALSTQAQSTINSTGSSKVINGQSHSYSIGEMVLVSTASVNNIVVTQGLLQPLEGTTGIETVELTKGEFKVFPNPTRDVLNLQANLKGKGDLIIKLYDVSGREMITKQWNSLNANEQKQLSMQSYAVGYYILNVQYKKGNIIAQQSYKIQKLK